MRLLAWLLQVALGLLWWPLGALRRRRAAPLGAWLLLELDGSVATLPHPRPWWAGRGRPAVSLHLLRRALELAGADARVRGLVVIFRSLAGGSTAAAALGDALAVLRRSGKDVVLYLPHGGGSQAALLARVASRVLIGPECDFTPVGYQVEALYPRRLLERAGVQAEVLARGQYKTAGESLVRDAMSPEQREQLGAMLDDAHDALVTALVEGRGLTREAAALAIDEAPYTSTAALERGLVDGIAYPDELPRLLTGSDDGEARLQPVARYLQRRDQALARPPWRPYLALVEVHGTIVGRSQSPPPGVAEERSVCLALETARRDPRVRGVLVSIDSRGGAALASDRMLRAVRRVAEKKPVVACMQGAAASGGYMVAVGAPVIFAQPTTLTGSIGVIAARPHVEALLATLGVHVEVVKRGARADMGSLARPLAADARAVLERQMDEIYAAFLRAVAEGRKKTVAEIEPFAGGRVWTGRAALERGLVDHLGDAHAAVTELKRRAGDLELRLVAVRTGAGGLLPRLLRGLVAPLAPGGALGEGLADLATLAATGDQLWLWSPVREREQ